MSQASQRSRIRLLRCISTIANVTHKLAREVFDNYENNKPQNSNQKLILVRQVFDNYNLISGLQLYVN